MVAADYEGSGDTTIVGPIDSTTAVPDIGVGAEEGGDGSGDGGEGDHDYEDNTRCSVDEFMQTLTPADYDQSYNISRARTVHTFNETIARIVRLDELAAKFGKDMQYAINVRFMEIMYRVKISPQCVSALYGVVNGLSNGEWWAFDCTWLNIDSFDTSLLPIGLTQGSLNTYGNYEQCLDVKSPATTGIPFTGKYCFVKVITPYDRENRKIKPFITNSTHEFKHYLYGMSDIINDYIRVFNGETNRMGVCVPSTCQPSELQEAINEVQFPLTRFPIEMNDIECTTRDEPKAYLTSQLVSIVIELYYIVIKNPIKSGAVLQLSIISNTHTLVNGAPKQFTSVEMIRFESGFIASYKIMGKLGENTLCSPYAYYLCVHIHLSILAPLLVYSLHKKPKFGVLINILVILSGCFACIYPYIMEGQTPLHKYYNMIDNPGNFKGIDDLINGVPLRQLYRTEIYLVAFPMGILAGFLTRKYPNILANTNWGSRVLWSAGVCWLFYLTANGRAVFFQFMTTCAVAYIYAITVQSVANYLIEIV
ncbi:unnamed protein product [Medioppia subpectinata]|uniref:Nose resistant-to-fluoxetine protein N-terminal domain-containing protein n=1 Tax=Medioppia subpectinata TaxID=1979941 RepID=A0A7R9KCM0_9ACAR|nr:unnamed protein product [Medioppia subpectinata]CAG2100946.1 unnamed protein product [Medioppia subpectinata]